MNYIIDTCVLAEIRHPKGNPQVKQKIAELDEEQILISALTIGEIVKGIEKLAAGSKKRNELELWLSQIIEYYQDRILPIDTQISILWGMLTSEAASKGEVIPVIDGLIAATAIHHQCTVITRNSRHFEISGAANYDPWE